jgi:Tol biopolymer transport system component
MKTILILLLTCCTFGLCAQVKSYDYAYEKKKGICVYAVAGKTEVLVTQGHDPCISPYGTKLAYTVYSKNGNRTIGIIDLNTRQKTLLRTGSNNCFGPAWSYDGKYIAYHVFDEKKVNWSIAVIGSANGTPRVITKKQEQCYAPAWRYDSESVIAQNLDDIFVFDLSGNIINDYKVTDVVKGMGLSSTDRVLFSPDGKKMIYTCDVDEPGYDGPPSAAFVYDIGNKTSVRLSPKGYYATGVWLQGDKVLFTGGKIQSMVSNVYIVGTDGKNLKLLFANCSNISAKR